MSVKLIKACKELNVSMKTAVEVLSKEGYAISYDPNYRLTNEEYLILIQKFSSNDDSISYKSNDMPRQSIIADSTWSDEEIIVHLKSFWNTDSLQLSGEFDGEQFNQIKCNGKFVRYPNGKSVYFNQKKYKDKFIIGETYTFTCHLAERNFREQVGNLYLLSIDLRTIIIQGSLTPISDKGNKQKNISEEVVKKVMTRLRLRDRYFIGQIAKTKSGNDYIVTDIRNSDFTKVEDKERDIKNISIFIKGDWIANADIHQYSYYKFSWVLLNDEPLQFGYNREDRIIPLYPTDIVQCLHMGIANYPAGAARKITNMLDTLRRQLTQSGKEVFIYELLQNANDYPQRDKITKHIKPVDVRFRITENYLFFEHSGDYFNPKNIAAICDINDGKKSDKSEAIGYKGIGFKTVFLDNDYVYLRTGNYSFRFDKNAPENDAINSPWQILPIWTDPSQLNENIEDIFRRTNSREYRVKFALKPRDVRILQNEKDGSYIALFKQVFDTERVILFIPNIHSVSVFLGNQATPAIIRTKDNDSWCVSDSFVDDIPPYITQKINAVLSDSNADKDGGYDKIPEKYRNFEKTSIKFACKKDGHQLLPVENAHLYCYLPAKKADWGFKFLMNTDMVPNGERDDIEDIEINHEIAKIAGQQFYYWIKSLMESNKYDMNSIFNLIPNFNDCIEKHRGYSDFIKEFQDEFENLIKSEPFIPCVDSIGKETLATIDDVINDETGLSAASIMSDTDFIQLSNTGCNNLPIQEVRASQAFHDFVYRYSLADNDFNFDKLSDVCENDDFQDWLKNTNQDIAFIKFLLEKDKLSDFADKDIFVENEGELFAANNLYLDFTHFERIPFFENKIPFLHQSVLKNIQNIPEWASFASDAFMQFDADNVLSSFVFDDYNLEDSLETLEDKANSIAFFAFVSENNVDVSNLPEEMPFFTESNEIIRGFEDKNIYYFCKEVQELASLEWLPDDSIYILSHDYLLDSDLQEKLKETFNQLGVSEYSDESFITQFVIEDTDFASSVNELITDDFSANLAFVKYLFEHREYLKGKDNQLGSYVLSCVNADGDSLYLCDDDQRYFSQVVRTNIKQYDECVSYPWLNVDMMYSLDNDYLQNLTDTDKNELISFLRQSFGVKTFTDNSFWNDVVLKNKQSIFENLADEENIRSFVSYISEVASVVFSDSTYRVSNLKDMPLLLSNGDICEERNLPIIIYDDVANDLERQSWYSEQYYLLDKFYSDLLSKSYLLKLEFDNFNLSETLTQLVQDKSFNVSDTDDNIQFWLWVKQHEKEIPDISILKDICLLDTDDTTDYNPSELYISDIYQENKIESIVKKFKSDAAFISEKFLEESTSAEKKKEWVKFFKKLGAKSDHNDILDDIINSIDSFEDDILDEVLALLSQSSKEILSNWDKYEKQLQKLKVHTNDGSYQTLDDCIIISSIREDAIPFSYIPLSNEVVQSIIQSHPKIILKIAESFDVDNIIKDRIELAKRKIEEYIDVIQEDNGQRNKIHIQFIRELAEIGGQYNFDKDLLAKIELLAKDNEYYELEDLTLGSKYAPLCNFEKYAIDLRYISDDYLTEDNKDLIIKLFRRTLKIHNDFEISDIQYLSNRSFAIYVWNKVFANKAGEFEQWIKDGEFNNVPCIPTATTVKCANELYVPWLEEYVRYCPNAEEKLPAKDVVNRLGTYHSTFIQLPFKTKLESVDCLEFLLNAKEKTEEENRHREQIINWLIANDDISEYNIEQYRNNEKALWRNGKNERVHISTMFAIHPKAIQQKQIFSSNQYIIKTTAFPDEVNQFEKICDILKISILNAEDFETIPTPNNQNETTFILRKIKAKLLILAAIEHEKHYKDWYQKYWDAIAQYSFYVCEKIELQYQNICEEVERVFVDVENKKIYYVNSWDNKRTYTKFCKHIKDILNLSVSSEIYEDVLDESMLVEKCIDKYCYSLKSDPSFIDYLNKEMQEEVKGLQEEETMASEDFYSTDTPNTEDSEEQDDSANDVEIEESNVETIDNNAGMTLNNVDDTLDESDNDHEEEESTDKYSEDPDFENDEYDTEDISLPLHRQDKFGDAFVRKYKVKVGDSEHEVVCEHYRSGTWVNDYYRSDGTFVRGHWRGDAIVGEHLRRKIEQTHITNTSTTINSKSSQQESTHGTTPTTEINNSNDVTTSGQGHIPTETKDPIVETHPTKEGSIIVDNDDVDDNYRYPNRTKNPNVENYKPNPNNSLPTGWKDKEVNQAELSVMDISDDECEKINSYIGGGKTKNEIIDEHLLVRYRLYNALINKYQQNLKISAKDFMLSKSDIIETEGSYIYARSAKGGILFISAFLWNKLQRKEGRICMYYGNKAYDFALIESVEQLIQYVGRDNVIVQIAGQDKLATIDAVLNGKGVSSSNVHVLIRIKSNERYNSLFTTVFSNNDNNGTDF